MPPEIHFPYEEIAQMSERVRELCVRRDVRIKKLADLSKLLILASNAVALGSGPPSVELCRAHRVLAAILACEDEPELGAPLKRIASSPLDPASQAHSPGKDALFELETLQYIRHRGLKARLGEPDVIVSAPFGDYFVACKTIDSLNGFEGQLRRGTHQVEKRGYGCIAFNLEPHSLVDQPIRVQNSNALVDRLDTHLRSLYMKHKRLIDVRLEAARLDGVMLQISCFAQIAQGGSDMDVFTHTVFYSRSDLQGAAARERFNGFSLSMQGPLVSL